MKKYAAYFLLFIAFLGAFPANAQEKDQSLSPYFLVQSDDPTIDQLPLKSTSAEVNIVGVIADVRIRQVYENLGSKPLEAVYVFPASTRAAVYHMEMQIGNRTVRAEIKEKQQARKDYEQAKSEGKRSALLTQERPNVFQMNVANIPAGERIEVLLKYTELLIPEKGVYEFVYPTVVGPRYVGSDETASSTAFAANPHQKAGQAPTYDFDIDLQISAGIPLQEVQSPTHQIISRYETLKDAVVELDSAEKKGGNRDFILQYRLAGGQIESGLLLYEGEKENHFLLMVQPPKKIAIHQIPPREYVFVVDVSGSMNGFPLNISKTLLRNLLSNLRPTDRFNVLLFAGGSNWLSEESLFANEANLEKALNVIDHQRGKGGTRLLPALKKALALPRCKLGLSRSIVVISDGYISVEEQAFDLIRNHLQEANVFSFGIGRSVNRFLMEGLAYVGNGEPMIITEPGLAAAQAEKFREYINRPILTQVQTGFGAFDTYDLNLQAIPDVLAERPIILFGKYRNSASGKVQVKGYTADSQPFTYSIDLNTVRPQRKNSALTYLWARDRIRRLSDYNRLHNKPARVKEITQLGLDYHLMTNYTSFVAIDHEPIKDKEQLTKIRQALPMPSGVSNTAIGFEMAIEEVVEVGEKLNLFDNSPIDLSQTKVKNLAIDDPQIRKHRESITFILGEDEDTDNSYYEAAFQYYTQHPEERTEYVIRHCRSLLEVQHYLANHQPDNGQPWGTINLVVHGNQWSGLSVPIFPKGQRADLANLNKVIRQGTFPGWTDPQIDRYSKIMIHGCGVGRQTAFTKVLGNLFFAQSALRPKIEASPYFVLFDDTNPIGESINPQRQEANYWYAFYKTGYRPGDIRLSRQFQKSYPDASIDWRAALSRKASASPGEVYHHTFKIPMVWTVLYDDADDRPDLNTEDAQQTWLAGQAQLQSKLKAYDMRADQFNWQIHKVRHLTPDGQRVPAIKAVGLCSVVCVLQTIDQ